MEERWVDIPGYEDFYQVSDQGRVRSLDTQQYNGLSIFHKKGRIIKPNIQKGLGSPQVALVIYGVRKTYKVYTLVCHTFLGPLPEGYKVIHINGDLTDNRLANLKYVKKEIEVTKSSKGEELSVDKFRRERVVTYNGKTMNLTDWCKELGGSPSLIRHRLDRGWSIEKALTTPSRPKRKPKEEQE